MGELDRIEMQKKIESGEETVRKQKKEKLKKERNSFLSDFKKFITKGNVVDLAVAVVVANAFNAIVTGLVKYIIMPFVTYFTSGVSIEEWEWVIREEVLDAAGAVETAKISVQYGLWLQTIVDFLIIAFSIFVTVRIINKVKSKIYYKEEAKKKSEAEKKKAEEEKAKQEAALKKAKEEEIYENIKSQSDLLRDIRELLKKQA